MGGRGERGRECGCVRRQAAGAAGRVAPACAGQQPGTAEHPSPTRAGAARRGAHLRRQLRVELGAGARGRLLALGPHRRHRKACAGGGAAGVVAGVRAAASSRAPGRAGTRARRAGPAVAAAVGACALRPPPRGPAAAAAPPAPLAPVSPPPRPPHSPSSLMYLRYALLVAPPLPPPLVLTAPVQPHFLMRKQFHTALWLSSLIVTLRLFSSVRGGARGGWAAGSGSGACGALAQRANRQARI